MHEQVSSPMPPSSSGPKTKKPLDIVVKFALSVFVGSFALIWGGMYLSRPDRTIPPYTVGAQSGPIVTTDVPAGTEDDQIEKLLKRFRKVGHQTRDFGPMKIYPTTPGDSEGRYRHIVIYVFDDHRRTDPEVLARYLGGDGGVIRDYEHSMRGYYRLQDQEEEGGLGPIPKNHDVSNDTRILFKGRVTDPLPVEAEPGPGKPISPF
ncbi:hypothetical protein [Candidatus Nitrospira nitrificans]|uniref:Uncharacterized protein n=1 Tax=Candidatus Nitrospira nitrificans TaxID=1742973 RepID=A0A0S4LD49_9BACT|nr:hypothetical protein [Candidatus Nitrospira nitrificans]CUS33812.1 conserved hypothetical protein [Candidatus Nitrospira nitrificans]